MTKRMTRRKFVGLAALGTLGAALAACQPAPAPTQPPAPTSAPAGATAAPTAAPKPTTPPPTAAPKKVTLKIMHNWGDSDAKGAPLQSILKDFTAQNPEVTIQQEVFKDSDVPLKVETAFAAKDEPDVVLINWFMSTPTWTQNGVTIPVDDLLAQWGLKDAFVDAAIKQWTTSQGKVAAFPLEGYHWPMWYNTKILKQAGVEVPKTLADLLAAIPKIQAAGFVPMTTGVKDSAGYAQFALILMSALQESAGLDAYQKGQGWDKAIPGVEVFTQIRDAKGFGEDSLGLDTAGMLAKFGAGQTAMIHGGSWSYANLPKEMAGDVALAGFPLPPNSPWTMPMAYAGFGAKGVWITRNGSAKLDTIEKLVKLFYQPAMIGRFVEQSAMIPPLKAEVPVDASKLPPLFVQSMKVANTIQWIAGPQGQAPSTVRPNLMTIIQEGYVQGSAKEIVDKIIAAYKAVS